jgi:UDP-N-acetylglucosamine--N-acetylmuramyl-(pentapeptide) pyrophosphoryl-undecaprenol N-acetylglucosamine transferase
VVVRKKQPRKIKREVKIMRADNVRPSVLIMAGGTGGHVFPALAAAQSFKDMGIHVEWLGTQRGIEAELVSSANIPMHFIKVSGLRGKGIVGVVKSLLQVMTALLQTLSVLRELKPICVLGMGGFVSGPGGLASWLSRRPLVIHEQNAVAGTTNRLLSKMAGRVLLGYPISLGGDKARYIGNPVRAEISQISPPEERDIYRNHKLRLLVLGGSLGAKPINQLLPLALKKLASDECPEVWHQTGKQHAKDTQALYQQQGVDAKVVAFIDDMAEAYQWADLVLCRAGALTVAELTAVGVASVLVPLPHAIDDHQTENARWLETNKAGIMVHQSALTSESLATLLSKLSDDQEGLLSMAKAARGLAKITAAEDVAKNCLEVAYA